MTAFVVFLSITLHWIICAAGWKLLEYRYGVQETQEWEEEKEKIPGNLVFILILIAMMTAAVVSQGILGT